MSESPGIDPRLRPSPLARIALWCGPLVALTLVIVARTMGPFETFSPAAVQVAGVGLWMALWWMTEAIPIAATALIPLAAFPLLGVETTKVVAARFMNPFIMLLVAGFMTALAIERWHLHKRVALQVLRLVGASPRRLVLGVMLAVAVCSMWISNTASTLMMIPIATAILSRAEERSREGGQDTRGFAMALLLGLAYAASVGGLMTPIGSPPNLVFMDELEKSFPGAGPLSFIDWMRFGIPTAIILIPAIWFFLTRVAFKVPDEMDLGSAEVLREEHEKLGPPSADEKSVGLVFAAMALLWVTRNFRVGEAAVGWAPALGLEGHVHDATVAVVGALVLFMWPSRTEPGRRLLDWKTAQRIPWDVVLLFGGGVALAGAFKSSGLSAGLATALAQLPQLPTPVLILAIALSVSLLTEITSNTATTIVLMPVLAAFAQETGLAPEHVMVPAVLSASCAFMLPVATAPNAIIYGTGRVPIKEMVRAGFRINIGAAVIITGIVWVMF